MSKIDLIGQRFGRLVVIGEGEKTKGGEYRWICRCDCGTTTKPIRSSTLREERAKSCGCLHKEIVAERLKTHQKTHTRLYRIWSGIKWRCNNPQASNYKYYGGRGIKVCEEWLNDFQSFYDWAMANGYSNELSIDRINNDGNYEPSNCRWVTMKEQNNNRRPRKRSEQ